MFNQKLKDEIEGLKKELMVAQRRIESLTNSKPLLYTVLSKKNSMEIIADEYKPGNWSSYKARFFLCGRMVAVFDKMTSFTTEELRDGDLEDQKGNL